MSSRGRFKNLALSLVVILALAPAAGWAAAPSKPAPDRAQNVILMIADGFGPQHFGATWLYSDRVLHQPLCMAALMNQGRTGYLVNDTADTTVTDSAAAATQMATGTRVVTGTLSMSPDPAPAGTPLKTVLEIAQERGMSTGLVTTSGITDATPAAFAAHLLNRSMEDKVAAQELKHKVDVLMGGRKEFFLPKSAPGSKRSDERDLPAEAAKAGYTVVKTAEEMEKVKDGKVLGLFSFSNMAYEMEREGTGQPSLVQMTTKTLGLLAKNSKGFFAMIEGGRIDHAAHRDDTAGTIHDALAFDEAVCVAMEFQRRHPRTLLIVTSDHETGGMALIGHSKESEASGIYVGPNFPLIAKANLAFETLAAKVKTSESPAVVKEKVREALGVELTDEEAKLVFDDTVQKLDPANFDEGKYVSTLSFVLRPYYRVGFATATHTASPLFIYGVGPGSSKLTGFHHNTDVFRIVKESISYAR